MRILTDKGLLAVVCLFQLLFQENTTLFLTGLYLAVTLSCLQTFLDSSRFTRISAILYGAVSWFFLPYAGFLPLLLYDCGSCLPVLAVSGPAVLHVFWKGSVIQGIFTLFGCILAAYLHFQTEQYTLLYQKHKKTWDDSRERTLLLQEKNKVLREKQDFEIYNATLRERNRIARDIHDNVGHLLSRSILMLGAVRAVNQDSALVQPLEQFETSLSSAMNSIRQSVHDLHDDSIGLQSAAQKLLEDFTFCPVDFVYDMSPEIPREIKYCFLAVTKEALSNIMKHSQAAQAGITMREHPGMYQLIIRNNGTSSMEENSGGIGLTNMKDRVSALGGTVSFRQKSGFAIYISIPKKEKTYETSDC